MYLPRFERCGALGIKYKLRSVSGQEKTGENVEIVLITTDSEECLAHFTPHADKGSPLGIGYNRENIFVGRDKDMIMALIAYKMRHGTYECGHKTDNNGRRPLQ